MNIQEIEKQKKQIVTQQRDILDAAEAEDRELMPEEEKQYRDFDVQYKKLIAAETRASGGNLFQQMPLSGSQLESRGGRVIYTKEQVRSIARQDSTYRFNPDGSDRRDMQEKHLRYGRTALLPAEQRALQGDLDPSGGFLQATEQMAAQVYLAMDDFAEVRRFVTTYTLNQAVSLTLPRVANHMADPTWTARILAPHVEMHVENLVNSGEPVTVEPTAILSQAA